MTAALAALLPLYAVALRIAPWHVLAGIAAAQASLICLLLAIWLPWKLLALLGGTGAATWLPDWLLAQPHKHQVTFLAAAIVGCYALHLAAEKLIDALCRHGARRLIDRCGKTGLFNNQGSTAESGFRRLLRTLADGVFLGLASVILGRLDPGVLAVLWGWTLLGVALLRGIALARNAARHWIRTNTAWLSSVWVFGGFLVALALTVWQYWHGLMPPVFVALLALIVARQALQQTARAAQNLHALHLQRRALGALLLPDTVWFGPEPERGLFEDLQEPAELARWLPPLLQPWQPAGTRLATRVRLTESRQVALFFVEAVADDGLVRDGFLVKLFKPGRDALAQLEADLLSRDGRELPAPEWLGSRRVQDFACHLLRWPPVVARCADTAEAAAMQDLRNRLMAHEPSAALVALYRRSKPHFWQRVDDAGFARLYRTAEPAQREALDRLHAIWPQWCEVFAAMPLQVAVHGFSASDVFMLPGADDAPQPVLFDWTTWRLEPVGAAWPISSRMRDGLAQALTAAQTRRGWAVPPTAVQAEMAARCYEFERRFSLHNHQGALNMIPNLLKTDAACR